MVAKITRTKSGKRVPKEQKPEAVKEPVKERLLGLMGIIDFKGRGKRSP